MKAQKGGGVAGVVLSWFVPQTESPDANDERKERDVQCARLSHGPTP